MIIEITRDMLPFLLVMGVLIIGFSGSFYILFTPPPAEGGRSGAATDVAPGFANYQSTLLSTFLMLFGEFDIDAFKESTPHSAMAILLFCVYMVLGMIVLLNMLIAIMGDTFDRVKDMESLHFWKGRRAASGHCAAHACTAHLDCQFCSSWLCSCRCSV